MTATHEGSIAARRLIAIFPWNAAHRADGATSGKMPVVPSAEPTAMSPFAVSRRKDANTLDKGGPESKAPLRRVVGQPHELAQTQYGAQPTRRPGSVPRMFGSSLAEIFSAPDYDCRLEGSHEKPDFAVTRLRSCPRPAEKAPAYPADDALLVCVSLTPTAIGQWRARYRGREVGVTRAIPFATTVLDLLCSMEMWVRGPFDYLHYYLSAPLLRRIALDNGVAPSYELREAFFIEDLVVAQLTRSILSPVSHGEPLDKLALDQIAMLLGAHVLQRYCGAPQVAKSAGRGLQPWQKFRAEEMLRAQLEGNITIKELAAACSLSESHFARSFRRSFGTSVHQHLIKLRIERAKTMLSHVNKQLAEIAQLSGFCDQAAFTRTFSRVERMTPSRWRKSNSG
jgi:AraC family transcriptional regulator